MKLTPEFKRQFDQLIKDLAPCDGIRQRMAGCQTLNDVKRVLQIYESELAEYFGDDNDPEIDIDDVLNEIEHADEYDFGSILEAIGRNKHRQQLLKSVALINGSIIDQQKWELLREHWDRFSIDDLELFLHTKNVAV